jgi:hypothetical protein
MTKVYYQLTLEKIIEKDGDPEGGMIWWSDLYSTREACIHACQLGILTSIVTVLEDHGVSPSDLAAVRNWLKGDPQKMLNTRSGQPIRMEMQVYRVAAGQ